MDTRRVLLVFALSTLALLAWTLPPRYRLMWKLAAWGLGLALGIVL